MPHNFTPELLDEMREIFDRYDVNHDDEINASEMRLIMHDIGQEPTESEVYDQFRAVHCDGKCHISFNQFLKIMAPRLRDIETNTNMQLAFKVFDRKDLGFFNAFDVRSVMAGHGEVISEEDSHLLIAQMDRNGGGRVKLGDFLAYMQSGGPGNTEVSKSSKLSVT